MRVSVSLAVIGLALFLAGCSHREANFPSPGDEVRLRDPWSPSRPILGSKNILAGIAGAFETFPPGTRAEFIAYDESGILFQARILEGEKAGQTFWFQHNEIEGDPETKRKKQAIQEALRKLTR